MASSVTAAPDDRLSRWRAAWPAALAAWSRFTRIRDARLCATSAEAAKEGLTGSFAMIRLVDKSVVIDLEEVAAIDLDDYAVEILAHEIGHHVLAPASATDSFRLIARLRAALPTLERHAPMVANLYTDLLINDRLQRQAGLRMVDVYARMHDRLRNARPVVRRGRFGLPIVKQPTEGRSRLWMLYMGIYESLCSLEKGSIGGPHGDAAMEGDAWLGARLIRVYAGEWMGAAGRFATLLLPYLAKDAEDDAALRQWQDTRSAAEGADPSGAQTVEQDEAAGAIHPAHDPRVTGAMGKSDAPGQDGDGPKAADNASAPSAGQAREPFEYGEILRAAGIVLSDEQIANRYYRERALPYLVRFPTRPAPASEALQLEGLEQWGIGDPLDEVDWIASVVRSPTIIPELTTVRRTYGADPGQPPKPEPIDLDIYVDSSGSMPDPRQRISYLTLAGTVIALSALRTGARVQATLWSGKNQVLTTSGFVRDENTILNILTGYFGGGTTFPIYRLRDTFATRDARARPVHILMISDDGISTMFDDDERGGSGWDVAVTALARGRAGGTMALNLGAWAGDHPEWPPIAAIERARREQGWDIHAIAEMEDLLAFARAFSQRHYAGAPKERRA